MPAYSHIYFGQKSRQVNLACTLSIRNTDITRAIRVTSVDYYSTQGALVRSFVEKPQIVPPLGTLEIFIGEVDSEGGSGANFIVRWDSAKPANLPIVETVMIGLQSNLSISFTSRGQPIREISTNE
ncbi:MAG: DUF3124 domain-containing protein [Candidatus Ozemobacteraceae bacterium]